MNHATRLYPLFQGEFVVRTATVIVAVVMMGVLAGCAAPVVPATNVVVDGDVRDCSSDIFDVVGSLDVAIVIDTSQSTRRPTGFDIDRDGFVHRFERNAAVDRGDSRLAAQIAAVRPLLASAEGRDIRFSIVTFSGSNVERISESARMTGSVRDSRIRAKLTDEFRGLGSVLTDVLEAGSDGKTVFYAGMRRATQSLLERHDQNRRKIVLFMSDSPSPNSLNFSGEIEDLDPRMKSAAVIARGHEIVIHTFGLSDDSNLWRERPLGQIAGATGGTFHPIEDPRLLYCHLADSLLSPHQRKQRKWQSAFAKYRKDQATSSGGAKHLGEISFE